MAHRHHHVVIDYKTGKRWGNEVKHAQQTQLYALGTALRYDEIQNVYTELWYLDLDELVSMSMTRSQALTILQRMGRQKFHDARLRELRTQT